MPTEILHLQHGDKKALQQFIDFPHDLYANDPNYVPMIFMEQEALLNPQKSPFFRHSTAEYYLAKKDGKIVGRIAAIRNNNHINFVGRQEGFFGFFDTINDFEVAKALLDTATAWLKNEGLTKMLGPTNFSTNETVGVLIQNFDEPSFIMNTYNAPYYQTLLEQYGFGKHVDLLCYDIYRKDMPLSIIETGEALEARLATRGITIRRINMKNYQQEMDNFLPVYNASWIENTGFVPMTPTEVKQIAKDLKPIINPDFIYFVEKDGKTIGISIAVPNLNAVQKAAKRGRLTLPFLYQILFRKTKIQSMRVLALGTLKEYRRLGIDACLYARNLKAAIKYDITRGEGSWILENNAMMRRAMEHINGTMYRSYRLFEKEI